MKNIAIVIDSLAGGGAEKVVLNLVSALKKAGHKCRLLSLLNHCVYDIPSDVEVDYCFDDNNRHIDGPFFIQQSVNKVSEWIQSLEQQHGKFDIFFCHLVKTHKIISRIELPNAVYVVHNSLRQKLSSLAYSPIKKWRYKRYLKVLNGKKLVVVSKGLKTEILQGHLIQPTSVTAIYNINDAAEIQAMAQQDDADIPAGDYIIHVGRAARQKRHDVLFKALGMMDSKIKLVLLTKHVSKVEGLAKKFNVQDRVIVAGFKSNPYPWIKKARALVLTSDYEGLSMVLIEAVLCGTPVISTDCEHGPSEILTGDLSRWLAPVRAPEVIAKKLDELLSLQEKPNMYDANILQHVCPAKVAEQYLALID